MTCGPGARDPDPSAPRPAPEKAAESPTGAATSRAAAVRPARLRLPRGARLRQLREFQRVYRKGLRATGQLLTVVALRSRDDAGARLGVSVSKDHGAAVRRNKIKRLLREAFRHERAGLPRDLDLVLIPRQGHARFLLADLRRELVQLVQRIQGGRGVRNRSKP